MKIVFLGLSITSSWGNGHATTYRALSKALTKRGHRVHFVEKDVAWYRDNRDLPSPEYCTLDLYNEWAVSGNTLIATCRDADVVVVGSYFPDAIAATYALLDADYGPVLFYDIDTPITLAQLRKHGKTDYLDGALIAHYSAYLSFSGGHSLRVLEQEFQSPRAVAFYCSVDPELYERTPVNARYCCDLSYLGTYAEDRQPKLMEYMDRAAQLVPAGQFLVAGPQYPTGTQWTSNVRRLDHVSPADHPAFYSSARFSLNLTRDDMVAAGFSPSVRLFEASACGATILSDSWEGLGEFLTPGEEVLLPRDGYEVSQILREMLESEAKRIGNAARERILAQHTASHRALQFEEIVAACATPATTLQEN